MVIHPPVMFGLRVAQRPVRVRDRGALEQALGRLGRARDAWRFHVRDARDRHPHGRLLGVQDASAGAATGRGIGREHSSSRGSRPSRSSTECTCRRRARSTGRSTSSSRFLAFCCILYGTFLTRSASSPTSRSIPSSTSASRAGSSRSSGSSSSAASASSPSAGRRSRRLGPRRPDGQGEGRALPVALGLFILSVTLLCASGLVILLGRRRRSSRASGEGVAGLDELTTSRTRRSRRSWPSSSRRAVPVVARRDVPAVAKKAFVAAVIGVLGASWRSPRASIPSATSDPLLRGLR